MSSIAFDYVSGGDFEKNYSKVIETAFSFPAKP